MYTEILTFLKNYGVVGLIGLFFGWLFFKWLPDHPEYSGRILLYLIRLIPFTFSWKRRKTIEKDIHAYLTEEIKSINSEAYGFKILPKGVKIEWKLRKNVEVVIEEDEIVIRLGSRVNPCENFVDALILYLSNSFMPNEGIYLEPVLYEACKLQIAISMLRKRTDEHYKLFINKYYKPSLEKNKNILNYSGKLESIEKCGWLTPVFIPTLSFYAERWIFQRLPPSEEIQKEINQLLDFIVALSIYDSEKGKKPPLDFEGKYLKVSVVLVARKELAEKYDLNPHFKAAKQCLKKTADLLFIAGRGQNAKLGGIVARRLKQTDFCEQIDGACNSTYCPDGDKKVECVFYAFKRKG